MSYQPNANQNQGDVYTAGRVGIGGGVRQDASGAPSGVADGDVHPFVFNQEGRLKVSAQPAIYTATTGNITANGQTVSIDVTRASNIMFHCTGTFSTVNVAFEGSIDGGTTWFAVQAVRTNANTIETTSGNLSAAPAYAWEASVNALTNFRVRATAFTSGTQTWRLLPGAYATEPIPAAQVTATQPVSGTVTATVAGATLAAGTATLGIPTTVADVASAAITATATTAAFTPTAGVAFQPVVTVTAVGGTAPLLTIQVEESLDAGTTWFPRYPAAIVIGATQSATTTAVGQYALPPLMGTGNRVRYVQTVTGTSPTVTRSIGRNQLQSEIGIGASYKLVSAASTNATLVKTGPTYITALTASNVNAAARYLKLYDKATAPTVGTDPVAYTFIIPGATTGAGTNIPMPRALYFTRGLGLALTVEATDAGTTGVAANEIVINAQIS